MKNYILALLLFYPLYSPAQIEFQPGTEIHKLKDQHGENLALVAEDKDSYYVEVGGDAMAVKCHLQKFDKLTNTLLYSVPSDIIRDAYIMHSDENLFVFRYYFDKEVLKQTVVSKTINKKTGISSEFKEVISFSRNNDFIVTFKSSDNKLLIRCENAIPGKEQEMLLSVFDLDSLNIVANYNISQNPGINDIYVFETFINNSGNILFTYFNVTSKNDLYALKSLKFPELINPNPNFNATHFPHWKHSDKGLSLGYLQKEGADIASINIDLGAGICPDPYNIKVSYKSNGTFIDGIYLDKEINRSLKKCDAGLFRLKLDIENKKISEKYLEPFPDDVSAKLKNAGLEKDLPCERDYNLLHMIEDHGNIYFVYQVISTEFGHTSSKFVANSFSIMNKNGKVKIQMMMPFKDIRGNLIVTKMKTETNKFEYIKMIPYNFDQYSMYYNLDVGINAMVSNDKLYLVHLDNVKNSNNLENFDPVRVTGFTPKGANLVSVTIDNQGKAIKEVIFQNTDELYTCPGSTNTFLSENKILIHSRGRKGDAFDQYGFIKIK